MATQTPGYQSTSSAIQDRWLNTPQVMDDSVKPGHLRFELWNSPDLRDIPSLLYTIDASEVGRLDNIAYKFYGSVNLWWLVAYANNIKNSFTDMSAGDVLQIPDLDAVTTRITASQRKA